MNTCSHIYCKAPMPARSAQCARCGTPTDPARLKDPTFLQEAARAVRGLPPSVLDMHQILPKHPMALIGQLAMMDALNIGQALLQSSPPEATSLQGNPELRQLRTEQPTRFHISWYVDPRSPTALSELEAGAQAGARVVKLLPVSGYRLDAPEFLPFWEALSSLKLSVMVHTGFITARHKAEEAKAGAFFNSTLGDPLQLDQPARRFPTVPIIVAHMGGAMFYEAGAQLVTQHENIWGDFSGFGLFALHRLLRLGVTLDWGKVFWGNDSVFYDYPANLRLHLSAFADAGAERLVPHVFYDNGARFLEEACS